MMSIAENLDYFNNELKGTDCRLIAVSKTKPNEMIMEAYNAGQRLFGENKVQDLVAKAETLPKDIEWHMIGHLQRNKVKHIAHFVSLIHAVDSLRLLSEINKQAEKIDRIINCLMQIHIGEEETKFGLTEQELILLMQSPEISKLNHVRIIGLMGMATYTDDNDQIRKEFTFLKRFHTKIKNDFSLENINMIELSMGMTSDYKIAVEEGSTFIRVGTAIFGAR